MPNRFLRLILLLGLLLSPMTGANAQNTKAQEEKKARLEREIAIIDRQLAENASKSSSALSDLSLIRKKVSNRKELVAQSDRQIRKFNDDIYLTQLQINRLKERVDTLSGHYSRLILSAYKHRDARVWYMYMLASDNLSQAYRRFGYFRNLSSQINAEAEEIRKAQDELEAEKVKLAAMKKEAEAVKAERVKELERLRDDEAKADKVVKQLNKNKKTYQAQLRTKRKEVEALNREIERIISATVGGSSKPTAGKSKTVVDTRLAAEFAKNKGSLPWPVDGAVVGRFGTHYHPVYTNLKLPPNNGFDLAVAKGSDIKAVFDGVVEQVMVIPVYNQCVMVNHGNYFTVYCKLKTVSVKAGDKIKTGQVLGTIDTINGQTQLHFELWKGNAPQNPESWLK